MKVLYHLTVPDSPMAACDAVVQEVEALRQVVGNGRINHLYPGRKPGTRFPRRWWGLHQLPALLRADKQVDVHHIFNPDPFPFDVLRFLKKPVVYTAVSGIGNTSEITCKRLSQQIHTMILPTSKDQQQTQQWGIKNSIEAGPVINMERFSYTAPAVDAPFTLLMASAPWTAAQFQSKGVDALLAAAQQHPNLRLIFLWRGVLFAEMQQRIQSANLQERVQVINEQADVNQILAQVHATLLLVTDRALIKAHPHSLLESLAAGKPIIVSKLLPLASFVLEAGCGVVIDRVDAAAVLTAVEALQNAYGVYQGVAQTAVSTHFQSPISLYQSIYEEAAQGA